jgi:hypothetical protein
MEKEAIKKLRELFKVCGFFADKEYIYEKLGSDEDSKTGEVQVMGFDLVAAMSKGQLIENLDWLWKKFEKARECKGFKLQMEMDESKDYSNGLEFKIKLFKKAQIKQSID